METREKQRNIRDRLDEILKCQSVAVDRATQIARSLIIEPDVANNDEVEHGPDCMAEQVDMIMGKAEKLSMLLDRISMVLFG